MLLVWGVGQVAGRRLVRETVRLSGGDIGANNKPFNTIVTGSKVVVTRTSGDMAVSLSPATRTRIGYIHRTYFGLGAFGLRNYRVCASYRPYPVYLNTVC